MDKFVLVSYFKHNVRKIKRKHLKMEGRKRRDVKREWRKQNIDFKSWILKLFK